MSGFLFDMDDPRGAYGESIPPCDPHVDHPTERLRLSRKAVQVLTLLRSGPKSNGELNEAVGHRFGGRISDLRAAGYVIKCIQQNRVTGHAVYRLEREPT